MPTEVASTSGVLEGKFRSWKRGLSMSRKLLSAAKASASVGVFSENAGASCGAGGRARLMGEPLSSSKSSLRPCCPRGCSGISRHLASPCPASPRALPPGGNRGLGGESGQCLPLLAN